MFVGVTLRSVARSVALRPSASWARNTSAYQSASPVRPEGRRAISSSVSMGARLASQSARRKRSLDRAADAYLRTARAGLQSDQGSAWPGPMLAVSPRHRGVQGEPRPPGGLHSRGEPGGPASSSCRSDLCGLWCDEGTRCPSGKRENTRWRCIPGWLRLPVITRW